MASKSESGQEEILSVGRRYLRDLSRHYERFTKCMNDMQHYDGWGYGTLLRTTEWVKCCFRGGHVGRTLATTTFPTVTDPESILGELRAVIRFGSENAAMLKRLDTKSDEQALEEATVYNTTLTDIETGYKVIRASLLKEIDIKSDGFDFEAEFTAKVLKKRARVYEVPISYYGRTYSEGKKIFWYHGFKALWALLKFRFLD